MALTAPHEPDGGTATPHRLGRYEVEGVLGVGGMGAVYKARDPAIDRVVAIKTINPCWLADPRQRDEYLERFRREAQAAGKLSHPNLVSVYDVGVDDSTGAPFMVMEYVPGVTLETLLEGTPALPMEQALAILRQLAEALEEAHRNGIVHRDVKPGNVFVGERGVVKVADFGVARLARSTAATQVGSTFGTPAYLAPEVARGETADARSDIFALGVVAYRMLTGTRPFIGDTPEAVVLAVLQTQPLPPEALRPDVPGDVSAAVMRALAKSPEARMPSAEAFRQALAGAAEPETDEARPAVAPPVPVVVDPSSTIRVPDPVVHPPAIQGRDRRRHRMAAGLALAALALAFAVWRVPGVLSGRDTSAGSPADSPASAPSGVDAQRGGPDAPEGVAEPAVPTRNRDEGSLDRTGGNRGHAKKAKGKGRGHGKGRKKGHKQGK